MGRPFKPSIEILVPRSQSKIPAFQNGGRSEVSGFAL